MLKSNWRNADEYEYSKKLTPSAWAWEFLRRNPSYRNDWETFKTQLGAYGDKYPNLSQEEWGTLNEDKKYWVSNPTLPPTDQLLCRDGTLLSGTRMPLMIWYGRKWGLKMMANPDSLYSFSMHQWVLGVGHSYNPGPAWEQWDNPRYEVVVFDLTLPLAEQIKSATRHLEYEQQCRSEAKEITPMPEKRKRTEQWPFYLRVLDAEQNGATIQDMASVLLPHITNVYPDYAANKTISNWLNSAKKLRDSDYISLPFLGS